MIQRDLEMIHEAKQQHDGSRHFLLSGRPAAHCSLRNVDEVGEGDLRQVVAVEGRAELVGGHLQAHSRAQRRIGAKQIAQRRLATGKLIDGIFDQSGGGGDLFKRKGGQRRHRATNQFVCQCFGVAVVVEEQGDQLSGGHRAVRLLVGGHFKLQRASAPFRTTTTLPDKMSGRQPINAGAAA